jgi:hypothetical protein
MLNLKEPQTTNNKNIFVRATGEEFFVQESVRGVYLHKGMKEIMVTTPTDAILIIDILKNYLQRQYSDFTK